VLGLRFLEPIFARYQGFFLLSQLLSHLRLFVQSFDFVVNVSDLDVDSLEIGLNPFPVILLVRIERDSRCTIIVDVLGGY
jgi:hypothetical protein